MTTSGPARSVRSWPYTLAHVCYFSAAIVAFAAAAVILAGTLLFLPIAAAIVIVGIFWYQAARRLERGGAHTTRGRTLAGVTALLALIGWWAVVSGWGPPDPGRTGVSGGWLAVLGFTAISVIADCSLAERRLDRGG